VFISERSIRRRQTPARLCWCSILQSEACLLHAITSSYDLNSTLWPHSSTACALCVLNRVYLGCHTATSVLMLALSMANLRCYNIADGRADEPTLLRVPFAPICCAVVLV
jgi:hypothetical protein